MLKLRMTMVAMFLIVSSTCFPAGAAELASSNPLYDFFPFGMYLVGPSPIQIGKDLAEKTDITCADLKAHNFNAVWANNLNIGSMGDAWLSAGEKYGIKIVLQGGGAPDLIRLKNFEDSEYIDKILIPHWTGLASKYRNRPALLAYAPDEEANPFPLGRYKVIDRVTRLVESIDPVHPAIVMYNQVTSAELAAEMVKPKAIASDWYPFFGDINNGPHTRGGSLSFYTVNQERSYRAARKSGGPFWIIAQGNGTKPLRTPVSNEMRWQVWCSLYCGAKGVFFYYYGSMVDPKGKESDMYREAAQVSREIEPLKPLFLKLDWAEPEENVIYWIESEYVVGRTFVHRDTGARYLVLFNSDAKEAHPAAVELNRFAKEVARDAKTYDVRGRKLLTSAWPDKELKELMIGPGDGAVVLILDKPDTLEKHTAQHEK